jgi:ActR/RegA family two-component response regulator
MDAAPANHRAELQGIFLALDAPPDEVVFHYVRAVVVAEKGSIAGAARRLGMHRRTLQRMLSKSRPKPRIDV